MFICFPLCPFAFLAKAKVSLKKKAKVAFAWVGLKPTKAKVHFVFILL